MVATLALGARASATMAAATAAGAGAAAVAETGRDPAAAGGEPREPKGGGVAGPAAGPKCTRSLWASLTPRGEGSRIASLEGERPSVTFGGALPPHLGPLPASLYSSVSPAPLPQTWAHLGPLRVASCSAALPCRTPELAAFCFRHAGPTRLPSSELAASQACSLTLVPSQNPPHTVLLICPFTLTPSWPHPSPLPVLLHLAIPPQSWAHLAHIHTSSVPSPSRCNWA